MSGRHLARIILPALVLLATAAGAWAYWATHGSGAGAASVATLGAPTGVTAGATAGSSTVSVGWNGAALSTGTPAQGYYVTRTNTASSQTAPACGSSASAPLTATSCADTSVPDGTFTYAVIAVYRSWAAPSAAGNQVTVQADATPPTVDVSFPTEGGTYRASAWNAGCAPTPGICGTAGDPGGVSSVQVSIRQQSSGRYWGGTGFDDTSESFHAAAGTTTWRYDLPRPADGAYTLHVRASDGFGNTTAPASYVARQFTVDATAPTATVATSAGAANTQPLAYSVTFDEPVTDLTASGVTVGVPAANTAVSKSVSKIDSRHFTVAVSGLKTDGTGDGPVSVLVNANAVTDAAGNGNPVSAPASIAWDRTVPTRTALEAFDRDANGKVDQVKVTYNEALGSFSAGTSPWTLTNVPSGGSLAGVSVNGAAVILDLNEGAGAPDTSLGNFKVAYAAPGSGGVADAAGNNAPTFSSTAPADKAIPAVTLLQMFDNDSDARIDQVKATFSESLASYSAGVAPWTLANVPSAGSLSSASVSGAVATLTVAEGAGAADTAVGSFTVALAPSATGIRDSVGNQSSFAAQAPADKAGPVIVSVTDTDGAANGKFEAADTMTLTFSESVIGVAGSSNVVLTDKAGSSSNDGVAMSNLLAGTASLGRSDYISGGSASFSGSVLSQPSASQIKVTLAACSGSCASVTQAAGTGPFVLSPAATLTDAAGNAATGSFTATIRLF